MKLINKKVLTKLLNNPIESVLKVLKFFYTKATVYFYYNPPSYNPISVIRKRLEKQAKNNFLLIDEGELNKYVQDLIKKSSSTGCSYSDYLSIWNRLNSNNYESILECGSGVTSVIFAYYARKKSNDFKVNVVSMESEEVYHEQIKSIFPPELRSYIQFIFSEDTVTKYNNYFGSHYSSIPEEAYDFIFIDGPATKKIWNGKVYPKCFNSDIVNILLYEDVCNIDGLIDQRIITYWRLKELIPKGKIEYDPFRKLAFMDRINSSHLHKNLKIQKEIIA